MTVGTGISSEYFNTSLVPYWSITHADMQLCGVEGDLQTPLRKHALQPTLANVLVEAAALALSTHRSLVDDIARTEAIETVKPPAAPPRSASVQNEISFGRTLRRVSER